MAQASSRSASTASFVPETRFGVWFLGTQVWLNFVLKVALRDLYKLVGEKRKRYPVIVDAGCGQGRSFKILKVMFRPSRVIGVDLEDENLASAKLRAKRDRVTVELLKNDCSAIDLPNESVDVVLCHQTFHHLVHQGSALTEWHRILKPNGLLLFSESTRAYIHSWVIRALFAHPMDVQRTAGEYLEMIRANGFEVGAKSVSYPYLWWSRWDFGILERLGLRPKPVGKREETMVNIVARKAT